MVALPFIAIVDDDPGVRDSLDSLLRSAGLSSLTFEVRRLKLLEAENRKLEQFCHSTRPRRALP